MNNKIKASFDQVQASDKLKESTLAFVKAQTGGYAGKKFADRRYLASAACLLFLFIGGCWFYLTPTAQISIDINPSIELGVNRFDQVVSVEAYNADGEALAKALHIRFQDYDTAVGQILESEGIAALLSGEAVMTITVVGQDDAQTCRILSDMATHTTEHENTYCYHAHRDEVSSAHEAGLSYGKYLAFLELQALDPSITPEQIQNMTMQEIQSRLLALNGELPGGYQGDGHHGSGHSGHNNGH